jgi:hypothetical protein
MSTSRFYFGGKIKQVALSNIDLAKILPKITDKSWSIFKYGDLKLDMELTYWTIILYQYPGQVGHWCLLKCIDPMRDLGKDCGYTQEGSLYFFDPYGNPVDKQWPYLVNPEHKMEPRHVLSDIVHKYTIGFGFKFSYNGFNIQGSLRDSSLADSECGELCLLRIICEEMSDREFYEYCMKLGSYQIFNIIKYLDEGLDAAWVKVPMTVSGVQKVVQQ